MGYLLNANEFIKNIRVPSLNGLNLNDYNFEMNTGSAVKLAAGATLGLTTIYLWKIWNSYSFFKKMGIPTPEYSFIRGNTAELYEKQYTNCLFAWTKRFGKVYGYYEGHLPILVTSDPELINEVFVKHFSSNFSGRKMMSIQHSENLPESHLVDSSKTRWKRMRTVINPTFTPAKLKELMYDLNVTTERLIEVVESNLGKEIHVDNYFQLFTMDSIFKTAFGLDIDCQKNIDNEFYRKAVLHFQKANSPNIIFSLLTYFHELRPLMMPVINFLSITGEKLNENVGLPLVWLKANIYKLMIKRIEEKIYRKDYMQLLIDAQSDDIDHSNDNKEYDLSIQLEKKLTLQEVNSNLMSFLLAGYETSSTTLSYSFWVLAKYPEELRKLQEEIDSNFGDQSENEHLELAYDSLNKLEYLDMFIKEILRMYPIGNFVVTRRCSSPIELKGIKFTKDLIVAVDVLSLHYDQEAWGPVDPYTFYPLRHSPDIKRTNALHLGFGYGPRSCVGQRFALLELKLAFVSLLLRYNVVKGPNFKEKMEFNERLSVRQPKNHVSVIFKKRQ